MRKKKTYFENKPYEKHLVKLCVMKITACNIKIMQFYSVGKIKRLKFYQLEKKGLHILEICYKSNGYFTNLHKE